MDFIFEEDMDEVGSDIEAYCPKCKADTAHTVITKYEDEVRRVQCSTCGDVHAYRKPRGEVEDETPEPIAAKKRAAAKKPTWQEWIDKIGPNKANNLARPYTIREQYHEGDVVSHPKFGVGIVTEISENKAEVTFQDERRVLVHNRPDLAAQMPAIAPTPAPREEKGKGKKGGKGAPAAKGGKGVAAEAPAKGAKGAPPPVAPAPPAKDAAKGKDAHAKDARDARDVKSGGKEPAKESKDTKVAAKAPPPAKGKEAKAAESKRPVQGKAERAKAAVNKKEVAKAKAAPPSKPAAKPAARAAAKAPAKAVRRPEPAKGKVKARR
jgi:hypothetical protein